jgi:hypothetical protein
MDDEMIVLTGSKRKSVLFLLGSLALVALGLVGVLNGKMFGWAAIAFFGLGVIYSIYMLMPGTVRMQIDRDGIEMKTPFKPMKLAWSDVNGFYVAELKTGLSKTKMIGIEFSESFKNLRAARVSSALTGAEGVLPNDFTLSAEEMCELLNRSKQRWGSRAS